MTDGTFYGGPGMKKIPLKILVRLTLKTLGIGIAGFIFSWVILAMAFRIEAVYGIYQMLESFVYFQIYTSSTNPHPDILIIDEEDQVYDRKTYGDLIRGLNRLGAKVILFDILFLGEKDQSGDDVLVEATKAASEKVIHAIEFLNRDRSAIIPDRFSLDLQEHIERDRYIENVFGVSLPYLKLLRVTQHLGNITSSSDIARHQAQYFPFLIYYNDNVYPSLPLLAALKYFGYPEIASLQMKEEGISIETDSTVLTIPLDNRSRALINFVHPSEFSGKVFSVDQSLDFIRESSEAFRDKIVIIGNSFDSREYSHAPHFESYPNLFIYAALTSQILNNENIREGILESMGTTLLIVVLTIIIFIFIFKKVNYRKRWVMYILAIIFLLIIGAVASHHGVKFYVVMSFIVFCLSYTLAENSFLSFVEKMKTVFISFNHQDKEFALQLKSGIEKHGIAVLDYVSNEELGDRIEEYINQSIFQSNFTILIITHEALRSEWVMFEVLSTILFEKIEKKKKLLPILRDDTVFDMMLQTELIKDAKKRLEDFRNGQGPHIDSKSERLENYKKNLEKLFNIINESIAADFRDDKLYYKNLKKLVRKIKFTF